MSPTRDGRARSERVRADQRERLLRAAVAVVGAGGRGQATVLPILKAAGVSQPTLYELFDGVDEILLCACAERFDRVLGGVEQAVASQPRWEDGVEQGLGRLLEDLASDPNLARCLFVELCALGPPGENYRLKALRRLARALAPLGSGQRPHNQTTISEQLVAGGIWHTIQTQVVSDRIPDLPSLLPVLSDHATRFAARRY